MQTDEDWKALSPFGRFLHDNQMLLIPAVCIAAAVAWVDFGLWPVWVVVVAALCVLPPLGDWLRARRKAGNKS